MMHAVNTTPTFVKNKYRKGTGYVSRVTDKGLNIDIVNATVVIPKTPNDASKKFVRNGGFDKTLVEESNPPLHKNAVVDSCIPFAMDEHDQSYNTEMLHAGDGVFVCVSGKSQFLIIPIIDDGFFLYDETLVCAPKKLTEEKKESTIVIDNIDTNNKKNGKEPSEVNLDGEHRNLQQIAYKHAKNLPREERKEQAMISHGAFPSLSEIAAILTSEKRAIQFMICRGVVRPPVYCEKCGSK